MIASFKRLNRVACVAGAGLFVSLCASLAQDNSILSELRKTCAGFIDLRSKATGGTVKFENYEIKVDAGNSIEVHYEGVLLKKIEKFDAATYLDCLKEMGALLRSLKIEKRGVVPSNVLARINPIKIITPEIVKNQLGEPDFAATGEPTFPAKTESIEYHEVGYRFIVGYKDGWVNAVLVAIDYEADRIKTPPIVDGTWNSRNAGDEMAQPFFDRNLKLGTLAVGNIRFPSKCLFVLHSYDSETAERSNVILRIICNDVFYPGIKLIMNADLAAGVNGGHAKRTEWEQKIRSAVAPVLNGLNCSWPCDYVFPGQKSVDVHIKRLLQPIADLKITQLTISKT
jgi:hypothetical protein